ncbi:MAG TPA: GYD domain-containing protein [Terriglobales bacterium]|nr:GYD domain-containing protein [Terriglobales bacterium]
MPHYLNLVAYAPEGWAAIVAHPQNRLEVIKSAIEKLGGKIVTGWFAFGEYDVVSITEMPDNVAAAAIAIAFAAGGACKSVRTVPLLSQEEALQALKKAGECGYRPPKAA